MGSKLCSESELEHNQDWDQFPLWDRLQYPLTLKQTGQYLSSKIDLGSLFYDQKDIAKYQSFLCGLLNKKNIFKDWSFQIAGQTTPITRISQFGTIHLLQSPIIPQEVILGEDCNGAYCLAVVMRALAYRHQLLRQLFKTRFNALGFYVVKLFVNGVETDVVVDDRVPAVRGSPAYVQLQGKNAWPVVLEKAWAKLCGKYRGRPSQYPCAVLQELIGCRTDSFQLTDIRQLNNVLLNNYIVFAVAKRAEGDLKPHQVVLVSQSNQIQMTGQSETTTVYKIQAPVRLQVGSFGKDPQLKAELQQSFNNIKSDTVSFLTAAEMLNSFQQICYGVLDEIEERHTLLLEKPYNFVLVKVRERCTVNLKVLQHYQLYTASGGQSHYSAVVVDLIDQELQENILPPQKSSVVSYDLNSGEHLFRVRCFWRKNKGNQRITLDVTSESQGLEAKPFSQEIGFRKLKNRLLVLSKYCSKETQKVKEKLNYRLDWKGTKGYLYMRNLSAAQMAFRVRFEECENIVFKGKASPTSSFESEVVLAEDEEGLQLFEQWDLAKQSKVGAFSLVKGTY